MSAKQTKSQRAKLRKAAALKGWETRREKRKYVVRWDAGFPPYAGPLPWLVLADEETPADRAAKALASELNTKLLAHKPEPDPNPWLRVRAWLRRMVRR